MKYITISIVIALIVIAIVAIIANGVGNYMNSKFTAGQTQKEVNTEQTQIDREQNRKIRDNSIDLNNLVYLFRKLECEKKGGVMKVFGNPIYDITGKMHSNDYCMKDKIRYDWNNSMKQWELEKKEVLK